MKSLYESILTKSNVGIEETVWKWLLTNVQRITLYPGHSVEYDKEYIFDGAFENANENREEIFSNLFEIGKTVKISRHYGMVLFYMSRRPEIPKFKFEPATKDQIVVSFPAYCDTSQFSIKDTFGKYIHNVNYYTSLSSGISDIHVYKKTLDGIIGNRLSFVGSSNTGEEEVMGINELAGTWNTVILNDLSIPLGAKPSKDINVKEYVQGIKIITSSFDWLPISCKNYQHKSFSRPIDFVKIDKYYDPQERILHLSDGRKIPINHTK